ncbi:MAG: hypothetical protein AAGA56_24135, partial [Myxococcota bacterium]
EPADAWGKRMGVARELQVGDDPFDDAVYIDSDAPDEALRRLLASEEVRRTIQGLVESGAEVRFAHPEVTGEAALVVRWQGPFKADAFVDGGLLRHSRATARLAQQIPRFRALPPRHFSRTERLVTASVFLAVFGLAASLVGEGSPPLSLYLYDRLFGAACLAWGGCCFAALLALRGRSDAVRGVRWVAGLLAVALPITSFGAGAVLNRVAGGPATWHAVKVVDRDEDDTGYFVHITPVPPLRRTTSVRVGKDTYRRLPPRTAARILAGEGWLGVPWYGRVIEPL